MGAIPYRVSQRSGKMLFVACRPSIQIMAQKSKVFFPLLQKDCRISSPLWRSFVKDVVPLNVNPAFVSVYTMRTCSLLISSVHNHAIRCLSTAEVSSRFEEDESGSLNAEENLSLESRYRELDSLCKSVKELDEQIEMLKEQRRNRLAELQTLKLDGTDVHGLSSHSKEVEASIGSFPMDLPLSGLSPPLEGMHSTSLQVVEVDEIKAVETSCAPESSTKDAGRGSNTEQFSSELLDLAEERVEVEKPRKKSVSSAKKQSVSSVKKPKIQEKLENRLAESVAASLTSEDLGTPSTKEPKISQKKSISSSRRQIGLGIKEKHEAVEPIDNELDKVSRRDEARSEEVEKGLIEGGIGEASKVEETQGKPSEEEIRSAALEASEILAQAAGVQSANQKPASSAERVHARMSKNGTESAKDGLKLAFMMPKLQHPLPEWIAFLEDLFQKGYFTEAAETLIEGEFSLNLLHRAVTNFGRDRDDIFRLLPEKDLKMVADFGCPSLDRKPVNSSKRLRAFLGISEGDVCQECTLKSSCVRAFALPSSQMVAGTLDVVRIVSSCAEQLMPDSGLQVTYSEEVKKSLCNLLKKFVELSATPRNPNLSRPEIIGSRSASSLLGATKGSEMERTDRVPGKRGPEIKRTVSGFNDWTCPNCDYLNFESKKECRKCGTYRPQLETKYASWECPNADCKYMNFLRNRRCRECGAFRPHPPIDLKPGDWECPNPKCRFQNFARNALCLECETERPTELGGSVRQRQDSRDIIEDSHGWGRIDKPSRNSYRGTGDVNHSGTRAHLNQQNVFDANAGGRAQRSKHKEWERDLRKRERFRHDDQEDDSGDDINVLEKEDIDHDSDLSDDGDRTPYLPSLKRQQSGNISYRKETHGLSKGRHKEREPDLRRREISRHDDQEDDSGDDIDVLEKEDIDGDSDLSDVADRTPSLPSLSRQQRGNRSYRKKTHGLSEGDGEISLDDDADEASHLLLAKCHQNRGNSYGRQIVDRSESDGESVESGKSPEDRDHGRDGGELGFLQSGSFEGNYRKNADRARFESSRNKKSREKKFKGRGAGQKSRR